MMDPAVRDAVARKLHDINCNFYLEDPSFCDDDCWESWREDIAVVTAMLAEGAYQRVFAPLDAPDTAHPLVVQTIAATLGMDPADIPTGERT